jgi:hypothetical protein
MLPQTSSIRHSHSVYRHFHRYFLFKNHKLRDEWHSCHEINDTRWHSSHETNDTHAANLLNRNAILKPFMPGLQTWWYSLVTTHRDVLMCDNHFHTVQQSMLHSLLLRWYSETVPFTQVVFRKSTLHSGGIQKQYPSLRWYSETVPFTQVVFRNSTLQSHSRVTLTVCQTLLIPYNNIHKLKPFKLPSNQCVIP